MQVRSEERVNFTSQNEKYLFFPFQFTNSIHQENPNNKIWV